MKHSRRKFAAIVFIFAMIFALTFAMVGCGGKDSAHDNVISVIGNLPTESSLTIGDASAVEDARTLYDALTEDEKSKVTNYDKLEAAEGVMAILKQIAALTPSITSETTMNVGDKYMPSITGYEYSSVSTSISYSLKNNTAQAVLSGGFITAMQGGVFTVEATISYTGYNIKRNAEKTVTVTDPAMVCSLSGTLTYDSVLTDSIDFTGATLRIGTIYATVNTNGSWSASVPYGTYTITATHPAFVEKTIEAFVAGENTEAPAIEFTAWKAQGSIAHTNDGNETEIDSNFSYDYDNGIYQTKGGLIRSGISRINFDAMKVGANEDFVFGADLLYTGYMGTATSFAPNNAYHHGLGIYDGSPDIKNSEYSYGLLLSNAVIDNGTNYKGHFSGFSAIDTAPTQYAQVGSTPSNVYCGIQGNYFGTSALPKPGNNGVDMGQDKIRLTYVRKDGTWYMIAEIYQDGELASRYVRQAAGTMLENLNSVNDKTIYLGLVNQVTSPRSGDYDQIVKWGNVYFSTNTATVAAIDLQEGETNPQAAIAAINALPAVSELTLDDADAVAAARALYNALTDKAEAQVADTIFNKLVTAETALAALREIDKLQITVSSATSFDLGAPNTYTPTITGYEYKGIGTSISYALKEGAVNTAGAVKEGNVFTVTSAGTFTVEATVTYTGYNIEKKIEWTITVLDPDAGTQLISVTLKYDKLTNSIIDTNASVEFALSTNENSKITAEKDTDDSWIARVPYGEYKVTASYPAFVDASQTVVVSETMAGTSLEIEFIAWKVTGNGANAEANVYDSLNNAYISNANSWQTGNSRIDFEGIQVKTGQEFVLKAEIMYSEQGYANWKMGLTVHDGLKISNKQVTEGGTFSYGLLLANDSGGRFMGYGALDSKNTSYSSQGDPFGAKETDMNNPVLPSTPVLPTTFGQNTIKLTFVRKLEDSRLQWYMIAEWGAQRFVRQPSDSTLVSALAERDNKSIHLGLSLGPSATGITKWGNVYFSTDSATVAAVDLTTTTN